MDDREMRKKIMKTVLGIMRESDLNTATARMVRDRASEELNMDLNEPTIKKFVNDFIDAYFVILEEEEEEQKGNGEDLKSNDCGITACNLSDKRRVIVSRYHGIALVGIREFRKISGGQEVPTRKGISLTVNQWTSLKNNVTAIDKAIKLV